jgi:Ca2+-binding RTX toxin-like protein
VIGADGNVVFLIGTANDLVLAGGGNETLIGAQSSGNNTFVAGSGSDTIVGGSGNDVFMAGSGAATMTGGSGADLYAFFNGEAGGTDVITNFKLGTDHVTLQNYGPGAVSTALASAIFADGSTTMTLPDGTKVTFQGITHLTSASFV